MARTVANAPVPPDRPAETASNTEFVQELTRWLNSGKEVIFVCTEDILFCREDINRAARLVRMTTAYWDSARGWTPGSVLGVPTPEMVAATSSKIAGHDLDPALRNPERALQSVPWFPVVPEAPANLGAAVLVLNNFHRYLNAQDRAGGDVRQVLHNLIDGGDLAGGRTYGNPQDPLKGFAEHPRAIVFLSYGEGIELHPEIRNRAVRVEYGLPSRAELLHGPIEFVTQMIQNDRPDSVIHRDLLPNLARACSGLGRADVTDLIAYAGASRDALDAEALTIVRRQKAKMLSRSSVLVPLGDAELVDPHQIGGMDALLADVRESAHCYTDRAQTSGIPLPRGIMLMGLPGSGKSMFSKATGRIFREVVSQEFPVVRLDVGAIFQRYVGESEASWRQAKKILKTSGPCVAFIDEVSRAFAGMAGGGGSADSGVGQRVFGDFLSWCQDRFAQGDSTYLVFTLNDPRALMAHSPEFFRRVDQIYFVDLPDAAERKEIIKIHLRDQLAAIQDRTVTLEDLDWEESDYDALAEATADFVGDELAKAVVKARRVAFAEGDVHGVPKFDDLIGRKVIGTMKDHIIAVAQKDGLAALRDLCKDAKSVRSIPERPAATPAPDRTPARRGGRRFLRPDSDASQN